MVDKILVSESLEQCKANCSRKFIIHFRRPVTFDSSTGFGFDWFRPEYEEKLTKIFVEDLKEQPLYKKNILELKKTYNHKTIRSIQPYGKEYIASYLSLFAENDSGVSKFIKNKQKGGIDLDIETYQIVGDDKSPLSDDGTICEFNCEDQSILITPKKISLSDLINNGYAADNIIDPVVQLKRKNLKYYRKSKFVNIRCLKKIANDVEVKIVANFLDGSSIQIGQLIILKNDENKIFNIQPVKFIFENDYELPEKYGELIESTFAQSLINVNILNVDNFILKKHLSNFNASLLQTNYKQVVQDFIPGFKTESEKFDYLINMRDEIINVYTENGKLIKDRNISIEDSNQKITYLIFIDLYSQAKSSEKENKVLAQRRKDNLAIVPGKDYGAQYVGGVASQISNDNGWGNAVIIYKGVLEKPKENININIIVHELGHSLGLNHVFEPNNNSLEFREGYTDNIMDYSFTKNNRDQKYDNPYLNVDLNKKPIANILNKFQWDVVSNDQSITK